MKNIIKIIIFIFQYFFILKKKNIKKKIENEIFRYKKFNRKNMSMEIQEENLLSILNYVKSLKEKKMDINYKIENEPKVSFITPVFNKKKYLSSFISSIQNQKLKEYEAIFIDDFSIDKSYQTIFEKKSFDNRIKLIRNKKNMGTLYSRYIGQKFCKADYSIFLDCDDIVLEDGIYKSYNHIIKYNLDIVQFLIVIQRKNGIALKTKQFRFNKILKKPILPYIFYYDDKHHKGAEQNVALWDKLIKTKIMRKAFQFIGENYIKKKIIIQNDVIILFSLFQIANSYQYINEIGYYYKNNNEDSISNTWDNPTKKNEIIISIITNIEFLYKKTNDTYLDKCYCIFKIQHYFKIFNKLFIKIRNQEYNSIKNIIDKILNLEYIPLKDKLILTQIEIFILNMKEN